MNSQVAAAVIAASVSFLTLIGTLAAQYFGRRATSRQLDRTLAEQRTRTLNERFATAADQLGSDKPPAVRLAGVYAMAGLADDWEKNRQTCVDVICAYLRMPYEPDPGGEAPMPERLAFRASREVRHTAIRVITAHLNGDETVSWQGLNFDFTGVVFDGGNFSAARFSGGRVSFRDARFAGGYVSFRDAMFSGGSVSFQDTEFLNGTVGFYEAKFSGGQVSFGNAKFTGGAVGFRGTEFSGSHVSFRSAEFSGSHVSFGSGPVVSGGQVSKLGGAQFSRGQVSFDHAKFSGSHVSFSNAQFSGGQVSFHYAEFSGGMADFRGAMFSGGMADFRDAMFSGGKTDFSDAEFSGGQVDFSDPYDWSHPPRFTWPRPPPGVKLPTAGQGSR